MGTIKDVYDILKDLRSMAKEANNQPMMDMAINIQDKIFELKEQMQELKESNLKLKSDLQIANNEVQRLQSMLVDHEDLKAKLKELEQQEEFVFEDEEITLHFIENAQFIAFGERLNTKVLKFKLSEIFKNISLKIMTPISYWDFIQSFTTLCAGYRVDEKEALQLKAHFLALGLIDVMMNKKDEEVIQLTPKGLNEMKRLNTLKQGENK